MSIKLRIATGFAAAALATCGLLAGAAGVGATVAVAAPAGSHHHHHCPSRHKGKYPPGKCRIYFTQHTYHKKHHVTLASGHVFKGGEKVTVVLVCPKTKDHKRFVQTETPTYARNGGSADTQFYLTKDTPTGTCYVVLHGTHSHITLSGAIYVKN